MTRFMPDPLRPSVTRGAQDWFTHLPASGAASVDYTDIVTGGRDFMVYYRLLPWDHGAPALVLSEAGGCVRHVSGQCYTVRSSHQATVAAVDEGTADLVRRWLMAAATEGQQA